MNTSVFISEESARCMMCQNAPCTKACASGQPDRFIRSLRFDNMSQSLKWIEYMSHFFSKPNKEDKIVLI